MSATGQPILERLPSLKAVLERMEQQQHTWQMVDASRDEEGCWTLYGGPYVEGSRATLGKMTWPELLEFCAYAEDQGSLAFFSRISGSDGYCVELSITTWGDPFGRALIGSRGARLASREELDEFILLWLGFWTRDRSDTALQAL